MIAQPRASRTRIVGAHDGRLKIQVAAPPVEGEANAALIEFLSGLFGVPKRDVSLVSGDAGKRKRFRISGPGIDSAEAMLRAQ